MGWGVGGGRTWSLTLSLCLLGCLTTGREPGTLREAGWQQSLKTQVENMGLMWLVTSPVWPY